MLDLPADQGVRERALVLGSSFHLEAPAGSGKTSVLLARLLALLARVEEPEELLALTFTRKAAGELRTRVMELLWAKAAPSPEAPPLQRQLWGLGQKVFQRHGAEAALKLAPERLPIMTFHSFCAQLLRLSPQAGVPLEFQLLKERDSDWLKQEAVEELRRRLAARPSQDPVRRALVRRLVRLNNDWGRLARELRGLLKRRDGLGDFLELARFSREPDAYQDLLAQRYRLALEPFLRELVQGFKSCELGKRWGQFWRELKQPGSSLADTLPPWLPGAAPEDLPRWQTLAQVLLTQGGDLRKQLTPKYGFPPDFQKTNWPEILHTLPPAAVKRLRLCGKLSPTATRPEEVTALQDLVILLGETLALYEELCARRGALDFIALEQAALNLLKVDDPGELLLHLDLRLQHLLVDEFQDTSEPQMELICRLVSGWEAAGERTLVVVGDPKQSIYGWRQAKVRLFTESRQGLPCSPGPSFPLEPLLLTTNFRSTRTLIEWANGVFGDTVMAGGTSEEVQFHAATPRPGAPPGEAPSLAIFSGVDDLSPREAEARWLARQVSLAVASRQEQETIGILLFARTHLRFYLKALSDAGLAVRVREGLKLGDSRVVAHLHNLARALVRPQDGVAWAAVLRGPWSPQSLETLARVAQSPGELWPEKWRRVSAQGDCPPDLQRLGGSLLNAQSQVGRRPLGDLLQAWLDEVNAWPGIASWEGPAGVANARTYLDLLNEAESGLPEATFEAADFNLEEAFQPPDPRAQSSPVEVMTVHGAKGLEFDRVFLPYLDWGPLKNEDKILPFLLEELPGAGVSALGLARPYFQEKQSSLYLLLQDLKNRRIVAEARRLFYVAVTRARRSLALSGVLKPKKDGEWAVPENSPLGWLWAHYEPAGLVPGAPLTWPGPGLRVELFTAVPPLLTPAPEFPELPPPWDLQPEAAPYALEFPSRLAALEGEAGAVSGQIDEEDAWPLTGAAAELPRLRGEVIHRLLETLAKGGDLPDEAAVAAALRQQGLSPEPAATLAMELLVEVEACRRDVFLAPLLNPALPGAVSEWLLETPAGPGVIRRGVIDRLVFDGKTWWLLDYKTSRPATGENWDDFIARETEKYRPQLLAYREMTAKAKGLPPDAVRVALYFTACRKVVQL
jgi:ATP-dependent exoDNAse (exonuclease V) beta subunit